ncbi:MAG: ATP-binding cassette domain-containing protein [Patescibacteria group bacterium]
MKSILKIKNLTKIYGKGHTAVRAVDNVNLEVGASEVVLIMGPSGSGKTTLLSCAGALLRPTFGSIKINNQEITKLSDGALSKIRLKNIGFVFQSFNLLQALTAQENIEVVFNLVGIKRKEAKEKSRKLLEKLGLGGRLNHMPPQLSGGEQQRVAIARALALDADLILADEPTGNLDSKTGHEVLALLCKIACDEKRSVLVVSHDQRLRDVADRVITFEDGKIKNEEKRTYEHHDLVCGMKVNRTEFVASYNGKTYCFCSSNCLNKFKISPEKYINKH